MSSPQSEYASGSSAWLVLRKFNSLFWQGLCIVAVTISVAALGFVLIYLLVQGFQALKPSILFEGPTPMGDPGGGLRNAICGTLVLIGVAACVGLPFGILGGIYQVESKGPFASTVRFLTDVLNSIPSIVLGIFVYVLVVLPTANFRPDKGFYTGFSRLFGHGFAAWVATQMPRGFSALAGGIALGFIMIPTVMRTTEEILRLVPNTMREASLALGAPRWRTMWSIILPSARGGIITGIMLALSRVAGETAPLLFTALGNLTFSVDLRHPIDALPLAIYNDATSGYDYLHQQAEAGAILLILIVFVMSLAARLATSGGMQQKT
jgi:phosphate transport system permease protein